MFELKLFQGGRIPPGSEYDPHPLEDTFETYLYQGWLRGPVGCRLLFTLAQGFWNDRDSDFWQNADGPQPAMQLPDWVKFALTLAENSRRNIWTLLPQHMATDTDTMAAVWRALAAEPLDYKLALRFYEDTDYGLLAFLRQEGIPVRVRMGKRRLQGQVDEIFPRLFHLPHPMTMLQRVKQLRKTLCPGWNADGAPFKPRRAEEVGYGDWTFRNQLAAEPYRMDHSPLLHSRVPTCMTVTRHADGNWSLEFPTPVTLDCPCLSPMFNEYDELMALCGEGLAPGDRRWALVCDTAFTFRIPLASPCFGFAFDETTRTLCLNEEDDALGMMQKALTGMLRAADSGKGGSSQ